MVVVTSGTSAWHGGEVPARGGVEEAAQHVAHLRAGGGEARALLVELRDAERVALELRDRGVERVQVLLGVRDLRLQILDAGAGGQHGAERLQRARPRPARRRRRRRCRRPRWTSCRWRVPSSVAGAVVADPVVSVEVSPLPSVPQTFRPSSFALPSASSPMAWASVAMSVRTVSGSSPPSMRVDRRCRGSPTASRGARSPRRRCPRAPRAASSSLSLSSWLFWSGTISLREVRYSEGEVGSVSVSDLRVVVGADRVGLCAELIRGESVGAPLRSRR